MAAGAQIGSSSLCSIYHIDAICYLEGKCVKLDKLIKSKLCILEFSQVVETNLPSNLKIYLVFKAFSNPSSGLRDTKSELSF